jgi:hypothetical protein
MLDYDFSVETREIFLAAEEVEPKEKVERDVRSLANHRLFRLIIEFGQNVLDTSFVVLPDFEHVVRERLASLLKQFIGTKH